MSLIDAHSAASARIVHALITAETMRTVTLLMSDLAIANYREQTYCSADHSSIARESITVTLW
jgi:hypothetical protein